VLIPWDDQLTALHRTILNRPDEDTPRYAYADRLDESAGDAGEWAHAMRQHARLIRVQIESNLRACRKCLATERDRFLGNPFLWHARCRCGAPPLQVEAAALLTSEVGRWSNGRPLELRRWLTLDMPRVVYKRVECSRGFIDAVTDFLTYAARMFATHPLVIVRCHDWRPNPVFPSPDCRHATGWLGSHRNWMHAGPGYNERDGWRWWRETSRPYILPSALYCDVIAHKDKDADADVFDSMLWLTWGLFVYGRRAAGLQYQDPRGTARLRRADVKAVAV
jgi:uncharacterized protein (TIGR02996 family)